MNSLEYTRQLVAFESTSSLSNIPVTDFVEDRLRDLGFKVERIDYDDANGVRKGNVIGRLGNAPGGIAYFGHTDVVPAADWQFADHGPFQPTVVGDRLYGRGSCDMKGSVACMLAAAEQFRAADLKKAVYITCTADEEVGYVGAGQVVERSELFREMADADVRGIVGEPTRLNVVYAHKGTYGFRAISHGRAAHSSTREGLNANLAMIPFLVEMKQIHDETEASADWQNDEFDPPTISWNIGVNDHTHAINVKAPQSICTVYFRPMPGQDPELLMDRVRAAAKTHGVELQVAHRGNPLYTPRDSAFVTEVLQLADRESPRTVSYGTDGGTFCQRMKQLVVIGPGDIAQAHTADEWIELEQLERGTDVYSQMIRTWCCQES